MLYIKGGSTISYQQKRDNSNNVDTIFTFPTNDANTKIAHTSTNFTKIAAERYHL